MIVLNFTVIEQRWADEPARVVVVVLESSSLSDDESYNASLFVLSVSFGALGVADEAAVGSVYNVVGGLKDAAILVNFSFRSSSRRLTQRINSSI